MYHLMFIIKCILTKFKFFRLSPSQKAHTLKKYKLYFEAGLVYKKINQYEKAVFCFEKARAYKYAMVCYEKLGQTSKAIDLAETHGYHKEGALLCDKHENPKKAAYFYRSFKPLHSAKLYKKCEAYYDAGLSYMGAYQFSSALDCFYKCTGEERKKGIRLVEEVGVVLYFNKDYNDALKIFIALHDYDSVLECYKKLHATKLIRETEYLMAKLDTHHSDYLSAAYRIAKYDKEQARLYYYLHQLGQDAYDRLGRFIEKGQYYSALKICFSENYLNLAKQVAKLC